MLYAQLLSQSLAVPEDDVGCLVVDNGAEEFLKMVVLAAIKLGLRLIIEDDDEMDGVVLLLELVGALLHAVN